MNLFKILSGFPGKGFLVAIFDFYTKKEVDLIWYISFQSIGTHIPPPGGTFDNFHNFSDFQKNGAVVGGKMVIFGKTSS